MAVTRTAKERRPRRILERIVGNRVTGIDAQAPTSPCDMDEPYRIDQVNDPMLDRIGANRPAASQSPSAPQIPLRRKHTKPRTYRAIALIVLRCGRLSPCAPCARPPLH